MRLELLGIGSHVIAGAAGLALGYLLAQLAAPSNDAPLTASTPAPAAASPPAPIEAPVPKATPKERIALMFSLGGKQPGHQRDAELYAAILALAPEDFAVAAADLPKRLAGYGRGLVGQNKARLLMEAFMDRWLTVDAAGALRHLATSDLLSKLGDSGAKSRLFDDPSAVVAAAFRPLARHAPQWTYDWIVAQKPGPEREEPIRTLLDEVARRDIAQARRFFASFAEEPERSSALRGLVEGLAENDPRASFELAMTEPGSQLRDRLLESVMRNAARQGPELAQELLRRVGDPNDRLEATITALANLPPGADGLLSWMQEELPLVKEVVAYWWHENWARLVAEKVPATARGNAAEWAATLPNDPQRIFLRQIADRWAKENPAAFRDWLAAHGATLDSASASALRASFAAMAKSDAGAMASWTEALLPGPLSQQAQLDRALRSGNPDDAGAAYASLAAGDKEGALAREVADILAKKNCDAAADWVSQLGDGPAQEKAAIALIETWSVRDAAAAAAWLETQPPGKMRDTGLETYVQRVVMADPVAAAEWAGHITDRQRRGNAANSVYLFWSLEDPIAARDWLRTLPDIDENTRRGILREFQ